MPINKPYKGFAGGSRGPAKTELFNLPNFGSLPASSGAGGSVASSVNLPGPAGAGGAPWGGGGGQGWGGQQGWSGGGGWVGKPGWGGWHGGSWAGQGWAPPGGYGIAPAYGAAPSYGIDPSIDPATGIPYAVELAQAQAQAAQTAQGTPGADPSIDPVTGIPYAVEATMPPPGYAPSYASGGPGLTLSNQSDYQRGYADGMSFCQATKARGHVVALMRQMTFAVLLPAGVTNKAQYGQGWLDGWNFCVAGSAHTPAAVQLQAQKTAGGVGVVLLGILAAILAAGGIAIAVAFHYANRVLGEFQARGILPIMPGALPPPGTVPCAPSAVLAAVSEILGPGYGAQFLAYVQQNGWTYACVPAPAFAPASQQAPQAPTFTQI